MQVVKSEWAALHAQFMTLNLESQLSALAQELQVLQQAIVTDRPVSSRQVHLRQVQYYVEWMVPALLPQRAETAEVLVNINRFAARLLLGSNAGETGQIAAVLEQQIEQVQTIATEGAA